MLTAPPPGSPAAIPPEALSRLKARVPLFRGFDDNELLSVLKGATRPRRFEDGARIFREGEPSTVMFILMSGRVRVTRSAGLPKEELIGFLEMGDCLGEMGLIDVTPRSAVATAEGTVDALALDGETLGTFDPALACKFFLNFTSVLADRLRHANLRVMSLKQGAEGLETKSDALESALEAKRAGSRRGEILDAHALSEAAEPGCRLPGAELGGLIIRGRLENTNLRGADLRGAWFIDCRLQRVSLRGADLRDGVFRGTNVDKALPATALKAHRRGR